MLKKLARIFCVVVILTLLLSNTIYAAWDFKFPVTVTDTGATLTNDTGVATGSPLTLYNGSNNITVTGAGAFTVVLPVGATGTATSGSATVTGSPQALVAGSNSVTTGITTGTFTIALSMPTSRSYVPVDLGFGAVPLIDSGKINANGLNTNLQQASSSLKYMPTGSKMMAVLPSLALNGSQTVDFYTNYSPAQTAFPMIVGAGGYLTTLDNAALEPTNNFSFEASGYFDTSASASKNIINKASAFNLSISPSTSERIISSIDVVSTLGATSNSTTVPLYNGSYIRAVNKFLGFTGYITSASLYMRITGSPTGTTYLRIRKVTDDSILGTLGSIDVSTLTGSLVLKTFNSSPILISTATDIYVSIEYNGGSAGNSVDVGLNIATGTNSWYSYTAGYSVEFPYDMVSFAYFPLNKIIVADGIASGLHTIKVYADGTNFNMEVTDQQNLLNNGSFEIGDPPTGWDAINVATLIRAPDFYKIGSYSCYVSAGADYAAAKQEIAGSSSLVGKNITVGVWARTASNNVWVALWNGTTSSQSTSCPTDSQWHWLTVTWTVPIGSPYVQVLLQCRDNGANAYFDGAILVEGTTVTQTSNTNFITASTALGGASVPGNANNWLLYPDPYWNFYTHTVSGTEVLEYRPNFTIGSSAYSTGTATFTNGSTSVTGIGTAWSTSMIGGLIKPTADTAYYTVANVTSTTALTLDRVYAPATNTDTYAIIANAIQDLDNYTYYGAITFGSNQNVSMFYGEMESYGSTSSTGTAGTGFTIDDSVMPSTWFGTGSITDLPFYDNINEISLQTGQPARVIYFMILIGIAIGLCLLLVTTTRSALLGIFGMNIVMFVGSSMEVIPMWLPFAILVVQIALSYLYTQLAR